jgi:prolyl 4-hydroxylase
MYLSEVEEGGGTDFPDLGITVMPKKGRALLWPSIYNSETTTSDDRMRHQALPVIAGTKFAANGWIHLYVRSETWSEDVVVSWALSLIFAVSIIFSQVRLPNSSIYRL